MDEQVSPADVPATRTRVGREALWGGLAALVATLLAAWRVGAPGSLTGVWGHFDLTTAYAAARTLATHVLPSPNTDLAFPFGQDLANFPAPDLINLAEIKALAMIAGDPLVATNLYLVLSFGIVAIAQYALLRVVRIPPLLSAALAVSFSLLPWHFERFTHATVANYSAVSVGLILVIAVLSWPLALGGPDKASNRRLLLVLALAVYVGLSFPYYPVFITVLALVALAFQVMLGRRGRALIAVVWFAVLPTFISFAAAMLYRFTSLGGESVPFGRVPEESQFYGGALFTLLRTTDLWSSGWPIPGLQLIPTVASRLEADARNSTVGLIAVALAFLVCGLVLAANGRARATGLVASLGYWPWLFMISVLFFVVGGFGQAFSFFFAYQIRSWGRFSIVVIAIAYLILGMAIAYALERSRRRRALEIGASAAIVGITVLDLLSMPAPIDGAAANAEADILRDYGSQLDARLPEGCGVFTLPAYLFPEGDPGDGTDTYDPLLPYLFSQNARWSYGGVRGSDAGQWPYDAVSRHVPTLVQQATAAGFCAVQVDATAFIGDTSPAPALQEILGNPVARSTGGRWVTFSLDGASSGTFLPDYVLDPARVVFGFGFDPSTSVGSTTGARLRGTDGSLFVVNPRTESVTGSVEVEVSMAECPAGSQVTLSSPGDAVSTSAGSTAAEEPSTVRLPFTVGAEEAAAIHVSAPGGCPVLLTNPRFIPQ